jgi:signal transduction histidine kinase
VRERRTIRSRVAISHGLLVAVILVFYIGLASCLFWWNVTNELYHFAIQDVETDEGLLTFGTDGQLVMREDYHNFRSSLLLQERLVEIRDFNTGVVLYRNERLGTRSLGGLPFPGEGVNYSPRSYRMADGTRTLLISHEHDIGNRTLLIRQAYEITPLVTRLKQFIAVLGLTLPITLFLAGLVGFRFASKTMAPLEKMIRMAEHITPKRLNERLPVVNSTDELGRLAVVVNTLLERIQVDVDRLQQFTSDVSHELRTPLAVLRNVGEVALQRPVSTSQYEDIIGSMLEEVNRLTRLIDNLLMISRMDAGQISLNLVECDAFDLLKKCVDLLHILAQEKSQSLLFKATGEGIIPADEVLLHHAFMNIIHNAIKFTPQGGSIEVTACGLSSTGFEIHVDDLGPGIPDGSQKAVFERFARLSLDQAGVGLGLAIAKWIVETHGGEISVSRSALGGSRFTIRVPNQTRRLHGQGTAEPFELERSR